MAQIVRLNGGPKEFDGMEVPVEEDVKRFVVHKFGNFSMELVPPPRVFTPNLLEGAYTRIGNSNEFIWEEGWR